MRHSFCLVFLSFYLKFIISFLVGSFYGSVSLGIFEIFSKLGHLVYWFFGNLILRVWTWGKSLFFFQKDLSLFFSGIAFCKICGSLFFELKIRFRDFLSEIKLCIFLHLWISWEKLLIINYYPIKANLCGYIIHWIKL